MSKDELREETIAVREGFTTDAIIVGCIDEDAEGIVVVEEGSDPRRGDVDAEGRSRSRARCSSALKEYFERRAVAVRRARRIWRRAVLCVDVEVVGIARVLRWSRRMEARRRRSCWQ